MKVLVTGATGFLGSHLVRTLVARGDTVHAFRRSASSLARLADVSDAIRWHDAGMDAHALLSPVQPDVVVHAATAYGRAGEDAAAITRVNLEWPRTLLAAARTAGTPLFVNIDTSLPPTLSEYARTKRAFAEAARGAAATGGPRVLNVRLESVYGAGDDPAKFQMTLLHALLRGEAEFALTPGEQARDYIHVADAVAALLLLVDHARAVRVPYLAAGVGAGRAVRIREFAETMHQLVGGPTRLAFGAIAYRDGELMEARADVTLLSALGWTGARPLETGLRQMIDEERRTR